MIKFLVVDYPPKSFHELENATFFEVVSNNTAAWWKTCLDKRFYRQSCLNSLLRQYTYMVAQNKVKNFGFIFYAQQQLLL